MMRAVHILVFCIFSRTSTLDISIDGPVLLLDCRSPSQDVQFVNRSPTNFDVSEEPVENTTKINAMEETGESTTESHFTEVPINPKELFDAAINGDLSFVNTAISQLSTNGLDLNWRNPDEYGYTALHGATLHDRPSIVAAILDAGADPDVQGDDGETPMYIAAYWANRISVLRLLLDPKYQADVNLQDQYGRTPVYAAAFRGDTAALELLLEHGGDPNKVEMFGESPLMEASGQGHVEGVRMLIRAGADINYAMTQLTPGRTALHMAAYYNRANIVLLLLENGADKNKQENSGDTAADVARQRGYDSVAQLIDNY